MSTEKVRTVEIMQNKRKRIQMITKNNVFCLLKRLTIHTAKKKRFYR